MMRRAICLSLIVGVLALVGASERATAIGFYSVEPGPTGTVRIARPTLVWRIFPEPGTVVADAGMTINDIPVRPVYSQAWGALTFTPAQPLPAGPYFVRCRVVTSDGELAGAKTKEWSFRVAEDATLTLPPPGAKEREALEIANSYRRRLNLPLFRSDIRLCASAAAHTSYLRVNRAGGHDEQPGRKGFTGEQPHHRIEAFDYPGLKTAEDVMQISRGELSVHDAVSGLFDAPYHREPFMDPGLEDFGSSNQEGYSTLNFGSLRPLYTGPPRIVLYPVPGQKDVPTTFTGGEIPDPLRMHGAKAPTGYILSYFLFAAGTPVIRVVGGQLTDAGGQQVPIFLNTPANDDKLTNGAFLIPRKPLEPGARYTATIQALTSGGLNISRTWSFTTADPNAKPASGPTKGK
jgi:hypothetical protein